MSKTPNTITTVRITISTNPVIEEYLKKLALSGLYGKNPAEAAERLTAEGIKSLIQEGFLPRSTKSRRNKD